MTIQRCQLATIGLCVVVFGSGSPVRGGALPLPVDKAIFLVNEETTPAVPTAPAGRGMLQRHASVAPTPVELTVEDFTANANAVWRFRPVPAGAGRVAITDNANSPTCCLEATDSPDKQETVAGTVQATPSTGGAFKTTQQWRVIEQATGAYLIQNVATGRFLGEPSGTQAPPDVPSAVVQLLSRTMAGERQWRILPAQIDIKQHSDALAGSKFPIPFPASPPDFTNAVLTLKPPDPKMPKTSPQPLSTADPVIVKVTVTCSGNRTSAILVQVDAEVKQSSALLLTGKASFPLLTPPLSDNHRMYLDLGSNPKETAQLTEDGSVGGPAITANVWFEVPNLLPPSDGFVALYPNTDPQPPKAWPGGGALFPPKAVLPSDKPLLPNNTAKKIINYCVYNLDSSNTSAAIIVYLKPIDFRIDLP